MRALVYDPSAPRGLSLGDAPDPVPGPGQVLVENHAISLNYGELRHIARNAPGAVSGWDSAGIVIRAAEDGSGPPAGARVVTFGWGGAWATLRAADVAELAVVPDSVELGAASTLPVAGVTALRALRGLGGIGARRKFSAGFRPPKFRLAPIFRLVGGVRGRRGAHVACRAGGMAGAWAVRR